MRAWLLDDFTGLDALRVAEVPDPQPTRGEVLLEMHYAGLNPADRYLAEKQYPLRPKLPHILGRDGIGHVVALGEGVSGIAPGAVRAILRGDTGGTRPGTFAQKVAVPADELVEVPDSWREEETAGATLVYLTAYQALTMWGPLSSDTVVLVTGASGGVGVASVQLAKAMGCQVLGLSRSLQKRAQLRQLGAAETFDPHDADWPKRLKAALGTRRVDLAVDNIGGRLFPQIIETLGDLGKVSVVGRLAGPVQEFNTATLFFRRIRIGGVAVGAYTKAEGQAAWREVVGLLGRHNAKPLVDTVFPFGELRQAFERLASGPMGKVLLNARA